MFAFSDSQGIRVSKPLFIVITCVCLALFHLLTVQEFRLRFLPFGTLAPLQENQSHDSLPKDADSTSYRSFIFAPHLGYVPPRDNFEGRSL